MKTAIMTCLFLLVAGVAAAQNHPSRKNAQTKTTQATIPSGESDVAPSPAPAPQPANRSINEKGLSTPKTSTPKKQNAVTTPETDKKEEKMQAKPQE